jgi:hypothetical protein
MAARMRVAALRYPVFRRKRRRQAIISDGGINKMLAFFASGGIE